MKRKQSCRTCRFLVVEPDKAGRKIARVGNAYPCLAPIPDVAFPDSVKLSYGFVWPPKRCSMEPNEGEACPAFEPNVPYHHPRRVKDKP